MKKIGLFIYIVAVCALGLAALEFTARLKYQPPLLAANIRPDRTYHHLTPAKTRGYMHSEGDFQGEFTSNSQGMRGPADYSYEHPAGVFRIAVLGDSFTFGVGVQPAETYCARLQTFLDARSPGKFEVLNFGVPSFSPVLEYLYLKNEALRYKPDLVILALDMCDIQDDYLYEQHLIYGRDGEILSCDPLKTHGSWDLWQILKTRSILCSVIDEKLVQSLRKMQTIGFRRYFENKKKKIRNKTEILLSPSIDNIDFDRFIFTRENKDLAIVKRHWQRTSGYLRMIQSLCENNSVRLLLTAYPYGNQVGVDQWEKGREYWAFEKGRVYDAQRPFGMIGVFARENGIPFVNLLEPIMSGASERLYYRNDGHWTPEGHKVAAEALFASPEFQELTNAA